MKTRKDLTLYNRIERLEKRVAKLEEALASNGDLVGVRLSSGRND